MACDCRQAYLTKTSALFLLNLRNRGFESISLRQAVSDFPRASKARRLPPSDLRVGVRIRPGVSGRGAREEADTALARHPSLAAKEFVVSRIDQISELNYERGSSTFGKIAVGRLRAFEQMVLGVSTRRYARSLEALPNEFEVRGVGKSAVSERFVVGTQRRLTELMRRDLSRLALVALMIDGVHFAEHVVLAAVGVESNGQKHVLGLREGATENAAACKALLADLIERGLDPNRAILVVIDGAKALHKAVSETFGARVLIHRCHAHKKRNVTDALPERTRASVCSAMNQAYATRDPKRARRMLENLARRLESAHPGAAASLREGLEETLTVMRLDLPESLERVLSSTNLIENLFSRVRDVAHRVRRWQGGTMVLRWTAAGVLEAERGFRKIAGYRALPKLIAALRAHDAALDRTMKRIDGAKGAA